MAQDERDYMIERTKRRYLSWLYDGHPPSNPTRRELSKLPKLPPISLPPIVWVFLVAALALLGALLLRLAR